MKRGDPKTVQGWTQRGARVSLALRGSVGASLSTDDTNFHKKIRHLTDPRKEAHGLEKNQIVACKAGNQKSKIKKKKKQFMIGTRGSI